MENDVDEITQKLVQQLKRDGRYEDFIKDEYKKLFLNNHLIKKLIDIVRPYHTGFGQDGCPSMCGPCRDRRHIRDKILRLFQEMGLNNDQTAQSNPAS